MPEKSIIAAALFAMAATAAQAQAQEAMTVVRDAETGKLRAPTAAETRAIMGTSRAQSQTPQERPRSVLRPDGTRALELGERGLVYSVATRGADGKLAKKCVKGDHAVDALEHHQEGGHDHK